MIVVAAMAGMVTAAAAAPSAPASKYASIVIEAETGKVLYERNADLPRYPASLTKVMTLYMAFEALAAKKLALTDTIPVSSHAATRDPSRLELSPGSRLKVEDAIRGMTTKSANDAAAALAEHLGGGSESKFAAAMTARAKALGARRTTFRNGSGLPDEGHVTTARDLAVICQAVVRDFPAYYHYFGLESFDYKGARFPNQNRFLNSYYGADGIKTGFINASGHNLAASAVRGGKRLVAVVLGGDTQAWTREHTTRLLDISWAKIDPSLVMVASNAEPGKTEAPSASSAATVATTVVAQGAAPEGARVAAAPTPPAAPVAPAVPAPAPVLAAAPSAGTSPKKPAPPAPVQVAAALPSAPAQAQPAEAPPAAAPSADTESGGKPGPGFFARLFGLAPREAEASTGPEPALVATATAAAGAPVAAPAAAPTAATAPVAAATAGPSPSPVQVASVPRREPAAAPAPRREAAVKKPSPAPRPAPVVPEAPAPRTAEPAPAPAASPPAAAPPPGPQASARPAGGAWWGRGGP